MKKLFSLLFAAALAVSLAMPVFAQDSSSTPSQDSGAQTKTKTKKAKKAHKKSKKGSSDSTATPPQQ